MATWDECGTFLRKDTFSYSFVQYCLFRIYVKPYLNEIKKLNIDPEVLERDAMVI